jgi:hypothetical protein
LEQNYPNPFNPTTEIRYKVAGVSDVHLTVYDLLGREVARLVHGRQLPGSYAVRFNARHLSSGVYLYRLVVNSDSGQGFVSVKKMVLVR